MSKKTEDTDTKPVKRSTFVEPTPEHVAEMAEEATRDAQAARQPTIRREIEERRLDESDREFTTIGYITTGKADGPSFAEDDQRDEDIDASDLRTTWSDADVDDFDGDQRSIHFWAMAPDTERMSALGGMTFGSAEELVRLCGDIAREHERRARQARNLQQHIAARMAAQHDSLRTIQAVSY